MAETKKAKLPHCLHQQLRVRRSDFALFATTRAVKLEKMTVLPTTDTVVALILNSKQQFTQ